MTHLHNHPQFRPPAEADSLIVQVAKGCPHNQCAFCGMYKDIPYRKQPLTDALALVRRAARRRPEARRVFLADGDAMALPFDELQALLEELGRRLPDLTRVSLYANGSSIAAKSDAELAVLRRLRLHTLYLGLESGDEETLGRMAKPERAADMVEAGRRAQAVGLRLSVMILLGLGGEGRSREHARFTAEALNRMQPRLLSALRVVPVPGTRLARDIAAGSFRPLTEHAVVAELRDIVAGLTLDGTVFRANHASNIIPLEARLPHDRAALLSTLDALLASRRLDRLSPGPMPLWL